MTTRSTVAFLLLAALSAPAAEDLLTGVRVPEGFAATVFAAPPDITYPACLGVAPTGEVFVGIDENGSVDAKPGRGRVVRCVDTDGDGRADRFTVFAKMDTPRGLAWDAGTLYVVHPPFVTAYRDDDGDGIADRSEDLVTGLGVGLHAGGEGHATNGCRLAIDGWLYIAVGDSGAVKAVGRDGSTIQMHGGGVVRVRPDGTRLEIVSRGQRNIYDVVVSPTLDLFTRDNSNDGGGWNVRLSHIVAGAQYGYPSLFRNFASEIVPPLDDTGPGSPAGALFLDDPAWKERGHHGLLTCEWTRYAVHLHALSASGAGWQTAPQKTLLTIPLPTDLEVDGAGNLYVASWLNGGSSYTRPDVGFVLRVSPADAVARTFPNLALLGDAELCALIEAPGAVLRLAAQREILRREPRVETARALVASAVKAQAIEYRVAAIFTLAQMLGGKSHEALLQLAAFDEIREFVLRAVADDTRFSEQISPEPFVAALADPNPRVRLAAITGLRRLGKEAAMDRVLPSVADRDPLVAHVAVNALAELRAADVCLHALDGAETRLWPGALRALQQMHEPAVVRGLLARLASAKDDELRRGIFTALCRLDAREAAWDGRWWGIRPDTSGPYFKPERWAASDGIEQALKQELAGASGDLRRALAAELQRHRVDFPGLTEIILQSAGTDSAARLAAVEGLVGTGEVPNDALPILQKLATAANEPAELRDRAFRLLQRATARPAGFAAAVEAFATLAVGEPADPALVAVWEEFTHDVRHANSIFDFKKLARGDDAARRSLAQTVLVNLAGHRLVWKEGRAQAAAALDPCWEKPDRAAQLLGVIGRAHASQFSEQVRTRLKDPDHTVAEAAEFAWRQLGLDRPDASAARIEVASLPLEAVFAAVAQAPGDPALGRSLFLRQGCAGCHTVAPGEQPKGPAMAGIAARADRRELCESILRPNAKLAPGYETQWFVGTSGARVEGFVTRESGDEIEVRNVAGVVSILPKKEITERGKRPQSMMPGGLAGNLTVPELASLLAYLESIKGQ